MLIESLVAWCWTPLLLLAICGSIGLLVERGSALQLPVGLLPIPGFGVFIVVSTLAYTMGAQTPLVLVLLGSMALAGLWTGRRGLRRRLAPGWLGVAAILTYGLYLLPVVASGGWTWTGYNFVNDTAVHFLLIDYLAQHGTAPVSGLPTTATAVQDFLGSATYPIGAHAPLAAALALIPAPLEAVYVPYIGFAMGLATYAFGILLRFAGLPMPLAAAGAVVAAASNLTYQYALQGNFKEMIVLALVAGAAGVMAVFVQEGARPARGITALAICAVAAVPVFSAGAFGYALALAVTLVLALAVSPHTVDVRGLGRVVGIGAAVMLVASIPLLGQLRAFATDAAQRFSSSGGSGGVFDTTAVLAQLLRPLDPVQMTGVWFRGDYRFPVVGPWAVPNTVVIVIVVLLGLTGVAFEVHRRRPAALLIALPLLGVALVAGRIATPYIDGKLYAIASPAVLLLAAVGAYGLASRFSSAGRWLATGAAVVVAGGVLLSDGFAYHDVKLAPTEDRFEELSQVGKHLKGGPWLVNEAEEFAKYYLRERNVNVANEAVFSPRAALYRESEFLAGHWYSLDEFQLDYVESFPKLLTRRSPAESRPPANFRRLFSTRNYQGWSRHDRLSVLAHLPFGSIHSAGGVPDCREVRRFARTVRPGERLVGAQTPEHVAMDVYRLAPPSWPRSGAEVHPEAFTVTPVGPGHVEDRLTVRGGRYEVWVRGSFPRALTVSIDGERVGRATGINGPEQWSVIADLPLDAGSHLVRVERAGGGLAPGDGAPAVLGPVVLSPRVVTRLIYADPRRPAVLCGRRLDWLERVRLARPARSRLN